MHAGLKRVYGFWLLLFFAVVYLLPLNWRALWMPDETRYAEISREMLQRGDWIVPHFLGLRYFEKPDAGYWINNLSQLLFGHSNFAVRFGSVFSTAVSALLVFWLANLLWSNRKKAYSATLIYLSCTLVFSIGTYSVLDPMLTLWMTAAMLCSYYCLRVTAVKHKIISWIALGLACAMGFMTKGFLALALPVIALLPIVWREKRIKTLFGWGPLAIVSALLLSLPWVIAIGQREPDFWHYFFWIEHIQRFAEKDAQHAAPFWYYLPILLIGTLPWLALLPGALKAGWQRRSQRGELFFLLAWAIMPLLFFSIAHGKLPTYILPCFAPLALLMADYLEQIRQSANQRVLKINGLINLLFGLFITLALLLTAFLPSLQGLLYAPYEKIPLLLALLSGIGWALAGAVSASAPCRWYWAAACPVVLSLLVGQIIPQRIVYSKQPQSFIALNLPALQHSHYVMTNSVGLASGLAWELKRDDILLYDEKGELEYGLGYPDAKGKFISRDDFSRWLTEARKQGEVALLLKVDGENDLFASFPQADLVIRANRLRLLIFKPRP